ncbi:sigma-70 family RNA polymerase sigma factor [Hymenobacter sp. HMF4947]|uniref:Sigma-70 family RNA polymerase sigma factor n=2 Tax=Hymenobacter ginkgonis TaxID=2682976 RepID=A0A7K1TLE4_9BACT|nr:sigma-70 family RNA polymerase sigma factor [Hymenobacter ginkgonis]
MTYFYKNYHKALQATIWRIVRDESLAQDVLQESMLKFWLSFPAYDSRKGRLFTWALNIARNLAIDRLRMARQTSQRSQPLTEELTSTLTAASFNPDHIGVRDWLTLLSPADRQLLEVLYFQGFTHTEAADELQLPLGTVKTRIGRIIRTLAQAVG